MSSQLTHHLAGAALAGAVCWAAADHMSLMQHLSLAAGCIWGASAPDWLELRWWFFGRRFSAIRHRTFTHWMLGWAILMGACLLMAVAGGGFLWWVGAGFTASALLHCYMDGKTPMGVPTWHPTRKRRL